MPTRGRNGQWYIFDENHLPNIIGEVSEMSLMDESLDAFQEWINGSSVQFLQELSAAWGAVGEDFELASEEEYIATDPISFDELMGGVTD